MKTGTVLLLIGPSASGKSSIQKRFQEVSQDFYIKIGIDTFFDALLPEPDLNEFSKTKELWQKSKNGELIRGIFQTVDENGNPVIPLIIGPLGMKVIHGMHHAIEAYATQGNNIIVDYILYDASWLEILVDALRNTRVFLIGIKTPLEVLEERERARGTSPSGHARSHYHLIHEEMPFDLTLDTSILTPDECVSKIEHFLKKHPIPHAIKELEKRQR